MEEVAQSPEERVHQAYVRSRHSFFLMAYLTSEGKIYDSTDPAIVQPHIHSFIETYHIDLTELLQPDPRSYMVIYIGINDHWIKSK